MPPGLRRGLATLAVGEHDRARAVGRRARLEEADRIPHHRGRLDLLDRDVGDLQVRVRVLQRVQPVLHRDHRADVERRTGALDVAADERRERTARADRRAAAPNPTRELRVALRLLLVSEREHAAVPTGLDEMRRHDARGAADGARGVHAEHRLARGAERVGEVELGLHHAFEQVGRLADDDRVDVGTRSSRRRRARASRPRAPSPPNDTSQRRVLCSVCPIPTIAHGWWLTCCLLRERTPGSAGGTDRTWSGRVCAASRDRGSAAPLRRCAPGRSP